MFIPAFYVLLHRNAFGVADCPNPVPPDVTAVGRADQFSGPFRDHAKNVRLTKAHPRCRAPTVADSCWQGVRGMASTVFRLYPTRVSRVSSQLPIEQGVSVQSGVIRQSVMLTAAVPARCLRQQNLESGDGRRSATAYRTHRCLPAAHHRIRRRDHHSRTGDPAHRARPHRVTTQRNKLFCETTH